MQYGPQVSVIIPTYNSGSFLQRCLDSVLNQSIKDIEIIAVDDLSTDNTLELLYSYARANSNMRVICLSSKGLAGGTRNAGLNKAKGKYISFIDSDDWIDTNYYHYLINAIESANADLALCGVKRESDNVRNSCIRYKYDTHNVIEGRYALVLLSRMIDQDISISAIVCNKLFKASFLKEKNLKFLENSFNEDDLFTFQAFIEAGKVAITSDTNYHLYQRKNSVSRSFTKKHIDDLFEAFLKIRQTLNSKKLFEDYKHCYYAFFEKCFSYLIETLIISEQDDEIINQYFKYAYSTCGDAISANEFIEYWGNKRIMDFFVS
jgi:glycosyltransferase involved in cell wall biosynthesis